MQKSSADNQSGDEHVDDAKAHDVLGIEFGNGQGRQTPERLDEISPSITPRDGHARQARSHAQGGTSRKHDGCLDGPMTSTRRHKHVQDGRTEEGEQRISLRRGNGNASVAHHLTQTDARLPYSRDDAHDTCIERKLK